MKGSRFLSHSFKFFYIEKLAVKASREQSGLWG